MDGFEKHHNGLDPSTAAAQLHSACAAGDVEKAEKILTNVKIDINIFDIDLYSPLHRASENGHTQVCSMLLKQKADPNISHPGLDGWTPLHVVCWKRNLTLTKLFLDSGSETGALDWYGNTAYNLIERDLVEGICTAEEKLEFKRLFSTIDEKNSLSQVTTNRLKSDTVTDQNKSESSLKVTAPGNNDWNNQKLTDKCEMVPSEKQAKMIEFSIKHCQENDIGGEWENLK